MNEAQKYFYGNKNIETQNPHIVKARYIKGIEALNDK